MSKNINGFEKVFKDKIDKLNKMLESNEKLLESYSEIDEENKEEALAKELLLQSRNMIAQCADGHKRILDIFSNKD